jgi:hypothetical protein
MCIPWEQSVPSHSHSCLASAVLVAHWPGVGGSLSINTASESPGAAPLIQMGPFSGLL